MKKFKFLALTALFCALGVNASADEPVYKYALVEDANGNGVWYKYQVEDGKGTEAAPYDATVYGVEEGDDAITELVIDPSFTWKSPSGKKMYFNVVDFTAGWTQQVATVVEEGEDPKQFDPAVIVTLNSLTVNIGNLGAVENIGHIYDGLKRLASLTLIDIQKKDGSWTLNPTANQLGFGELVKKSLTTLDIAKTGITVIPESFFGMVGDPKKAVFPKLTSVTLPDGLTVISTGAFEGFKGTAITFPAGLKTIGAEAFKGATALEAITIPAATQEIGVSAFDGCTGLKTVTFATKTSAPGLGESSVYRIGADAFKGCAGLTSIDLSKTAITDELGAAFTGCTGITAITLSDKVTKLVANLFKDTKVEEITALGAIEVQNVMGAKKDKKNTTLKKVTLGPVESLSANAFAYCDALTEVTVAFPDDDDAKAAIKAIENKLATAEEDLEKADEALQAAQEALADAKSDLDKATADYANALNTKAKAEAAIADIAATKEALFAAIDVVAAAPAEDITNAQLETLVTAIATASDDIEGYNAAKKDVDDAIAAIIAMSATDDITNAEQAIAWAVDAENAEDALAIAYADAAAALEAIAVEGEDGIWAHLTAATITEAEYSAAAWTAILEGYDEDDYSDVDEAYADYLAALEEGGADPAAAATAAVAAAEAALEDLATAGQEYGDAQENYNTAWDEYWTALDNAETAKTDNEASLIHAKAFYYCTALATFNYSPTNDAYKYVSDNAFLGCSSNPLVHFVTSTVYMAKYAAPFQTTYNNEAATTVKTVADKGTSGKFFNKFHATSKVAIDPAEAKVYSVYVDEGAAVLQGLAKKDDMYVLFPDDNVIIKTDVAKEVEIIPYNGTVKKSSVLIDDIWCFIDDVALAEFQENYKDEEGNPAIVTGEYVYRLTNNAASGGFGFTYYTGTTLKKGQFHIVSSVAPAADGRIMKTIWLDEDGNVESVDEVTGISSVSVKASSNGAIFNVAGQKVNKNYKGLVIKDGKKTIQK